MPVLKIFFDRFEKMTGLAHERAIERLPYLGLDIESVEDDSIRIEYNPNRPDFSTDYGIARALKGLVGLEMGVPKYRVSSGGMTVHVAGSLARVRPYIACAVARDIALDDEETIRQLISMQEDLHNGIGRKRKKVAIGLHNLDTIRGPLYYRGVDSSFAFAPLGSAQKMSLREILSRTTTGMQYGHILAGAPVYPILLDSNGTVLSFPPIINGNDTKVDSRTRNLFVDITSTDERLGLDTLAIVCAALSDAGAGLESARVMYTTPRESVTPEMAPTKMKFDGRLALAMTGLDITVTQMKTCLRKARLELDGKGNAIVPRYRVDILHPVDLAEEVAIGYGMDRIKPLYPASMQPGNFNRLATALDEISESMARAGFIETMNFDLVDNFSLYERFERTSDARIEVENPRTSEHGLLRDSLLPSLMSVLSRNVKSMYPQRIFEAGKVFVRGEGGAAIAERQHLGALIAHSSSSFSEAKMHLAALLQEHTNMILNSAPADHWAFAEGRCAEIMLGDRRVGFLGEVRPSAIARFGLDVPVSGFEIDLLPLISRS